MLYAFLTAKTARQHARRQKTVSPFNYLAAGGQRDMRPRCYFSFPSKAARQAAPARGITATRARQQNGRQWRLPPPLPEKPDACAPYSPAVLQSCGLMWRRSARPASGGHHSWQDTWNSPARAIQSRHPEKSCPALPPRPAA